MDTWRDRLPGFLLAAAAVLIAALLLIFRPDDTSLVVVSLSMVVVLLAMPVAAVTQAFGAPRAVVLKILPAGVITGGVLLVVGLWLDSPWTLLIVAGAQLGGIAFWLVVAAISYLRERRRPRS